MDLKDLSSYQFRNLLNYEEQKAAAASLLEGWKICCFRRPVPAKIPRTEGLILGFAVLLAPGPLEAFHRLMIVQYEQDHPKASWTYGQPFSGSLESVYETAVEWAVMDHWGSCENFVLWSRNNRQTKQQIRDVYPDAFFTFWDRASTQPPSREIRDAGFGGFGDRGGLLQCYPLRKKRNDGKDGGSGRDL